MTFLVFLGKIFFFIIGSIICTIITGYFIRCLIEKIGLSENKALLAGMIVPLAWFNMMYYMAAYVATVV